MCNTEDGTCYTSDWNGSENTLNALGKFGGVITQGMKDISDGDVIGMLLDLDEGTLSIYKNGRKLGIIENGLAGSYCWVVSLLREELVLPRGTSVAIKRGTIPPS